MTKLEFVNLIYDIMLTHSISSEQAYYLIAKTEGVDVNLDPVKSIELFNKNLLKPGGTVNDTVLFRDCDLFKNESEEVVQGTVLISAETIMVVENLFKRFVIDDFTTEEHISSVAKKYLKGNLTAARYFILFQSLFPMKSSKRNKKWNKQFGIQFTGVSRQDMSSSVITKYMAIFNRKVDAERKVFDFGYFLIGTWLYIKQSVDVEMDDCFCTKPNKFLLNWQDWYDEAIEYVANNKLKESFTQKRGVDDFDDFDKD